MDPYMDVVVHFDLHFTTREQTSALIRRRWAHHIFLSRLHKKKKYKDTDTFSEQSIKLKGCTLSEYSKVFSSYVIIFFFFKSTTLMFRPSALVPHHHNFIF